MKEECNKRWIRFLKIDIKGKTSSATTARHICHGIVLSMRDLASAHVYATVHLRRFHHHMFTGCGILTHPHHHFRQNQNGHQHIAHNGKDATLVTGHYHITL
jgi:hypothetical protein